jgi:hypothetical protein
MKDVELSTVFKDFILRMALTEHTEFMYATLMRAVSGPRGLWIVWRGIDDAATAALQPDRAILVGYHTGSGWTFKLLTDKVPQGDVAEASPESLVTLLQDAIGK